MLDIGWQEFVLVSFVLLMVVGPKDMPKVLKTIVNSVRKIKSMAYEFQNSVDDISNETEFSELKKEVSNLKASRAIKNTKHEVEKLSKINNETKELIKKTIPKSKNKS